MKKIGNLYRVNYSVNKKSRMKYFENEEEAQLFYEKYQKSRESMLISMRENKSTTAKHQDLPKRFHEYARTRTYSNKYTYKFNVIKVSIYFDSKSYSIERTFGLRRSREETISLLIKLHNEKIKQLTEQKRLKDDI